MRITRQRPNVIYMHMLGAVSQADTFDYKPVLEKMHGQELPASVRGNMRLSTMVQGQTSFPVVGPLAKFQPGGQSGAMVSDLMPHTRKIADDICIIRTMHTEHVNHDPASKFLHTGFQIAGRPSAGAWINYALGSNNQDLPAFIVMSSGQSNGVPIDAAAWGPGFIRRITRGAVPLRSDAGALYREPGWADPEGSARHARRHRGRRGHAAQDVERPRDPIEAESSTRCRIGCRRRCRKSLTSPASRSRAGSAGPDAQAGHVRAQLSTRAAPGGARRALHDGGATDGTITSVSRVFCSRRASPWTSRPPGWSRT